MIPFRNMEFGVKRPLLETERAYIAGFVDSDGSISLNYQNKRKSKARIKPTVAIYNTNLLLLEWINSKFPNGSITYPQQKRTHQWKKLYALRFMSRKNCKEFLEAIYPFLRVKQQQAEIVIRFCLRHHGRSTYNEQDALEFELMRKLNERGPP